MNKYKVQFTKTYVIDVLAENESHAESLADNILNGYEAMDSQHYHQSESPDIVVYDVTNTDDAFNPDN